MPVILKIVLCVSIVVSLAACAYEKSTGHDYDSSSGFFPRTPVLKKYKEGIIAPEKNRMATILIKFV
jgi:hypothetical protein